MPDFCRHCVDLRELPGKPRHDPVTSVEGERVYIARGSGRKGSIILVTDFFGIGLVNAKLIADKYAEETGFNVYVPDLFNKDALPVTDFTLPTHASEGPLDSSHHEQNEAAVKEWLSRGHSAEETYPLLQKLIKAIEADGPVGAVGYSYGAWHVAKAASTGPVKAATIFHPDGLADLDPKEVQVSLLLHQAEFDPSFPANLGSVWVETLKSRDLLDARSKQYDSTITGFGSRPNLGKPDIKQAFEESQGSTIAFFKESLVA